MSAQRRQASKSIAQISASKRRNILTELLLGFDKDGVVGIVVDVEALASSASITNCWWS